MTPYTICIPTMRSYEEIAELLAEIRAAEPEAKVIASCLPQSAAANRNWCLDNATTNVVIQVDDDCYGFPPLFAEQLVETLRGTHHCVMASARLMHPRGGFGLMMGAVDLKESGLSVARERKLPTACVAIWREPVRCDPEFEGSGFDDDDLCAALRKHDPQAVFLVNNDVQVTHRNERKQQMENWTANKLRYMTKWGTISA